MFLRHLDLKCRVNFRHTVPNPIEYNYGPRSVATGDFNNDTWFDMVVANTIANHIVVFFGNSNGSFSDYVTYSTGSYSTPYVVAVGHLNNDSQLDIAVANFGTNNVGIFLGLNNGMFANQIQLSTAAFRPITICLTDFDNDKLLDIATANYGSDSIAIFYGYGNGSFSNPITYSIGYDSFPFFLIGGDFNNDDHLDLAIANYGSNNIGIIFANDNRTFAKQMTFSTGAGSHPSSIAVGYFNNDTFLDIAVALSGTNKTSVLLNNGNGSFANQMIYLLNNASPYSIGVVDLNGDGQMDLVMTNIGANNVGTLIGYGNGTFSVLNMYSSGSNSSISLSVCDLNKDNRLDFVLVSEYDGYVSLVLQHNRGALKNDRTYGSSGGSHVHRVVTEDIDMNANLDMIVANYGTNNIGLLLGYGNGTFASESMLDIGPNSHPSNIAIADFDGDTYSDIAVFNRATRLVDILLGKGKGTFERQVNYGVGSLSHASVIVHGDFNSDKRMEIVVAYDNSHNVDILLAYDTSVFQNRAEYSVGPGPQSRASGDFNNDSQLDIVIANKYSNDVSVLLGYGDGTFQYQAKYSTGEWPYSVAVGDFNNDTRLDIVVANKNSHDVSVLLRYGNGTFQKQATYSTCYRPISMTIGDLNNDTLLDIFVVNDYVIGAMSVLLGYGDGTFRKQKNMQLFRHNM